MLTRRSIVCKVQRELVCMGDDIDAAHETLIAIDRTSIDDIALHCVREITARKYLPSVANGSTWVAEADGLPFAVVALDVGGRITVTPAGSRVMVSDGGLTLFFSYQLKRDPAELVAEIGAGKRPKR